MNCRHCFEPLNLPFVDLNSSPPSNAYLTSAGQFELEISYPLRISCCQNCWLVQTEDFASASELFDTEYAYFSSFSSSWLEHSKKYTETVIERFSLGASSTVVEVAANDGYLLQYFQKNDIPNYGIEPTASTANAAREKGIEIVEDFFGERVAEKLKIERGQADLIIANNVLAHVPNINDFVRGFTVLLKPGGVATFEFPHLCRLVSNNQFDTIYHEHFSYLSLSFITKLLVFCGLQIFDIDELETHGGSLRVYCQRLDTGAHNISLKVNSLVEREIELGVQSKAYYLGFQNKIDSVCNEFLNFIYDAKSQGLKIAAYGAAAKGNTFLNYLMLTDKDIPYVVDLNPAKQGKFLPGSRIPIVDEQHLKEDKPNCIIVFPWNLIDEIQDQLKYIEAWDGRLVTALPNFRYVTSGKGS